MTSEFSKLSLHNHFGGDATHRSDKTIDIHVETNSCYFDTKLAFSKIDALAKQEYKLLGMTNSNTIWPKDFLLCRQYAKKLGIELLPGIEINVIENTIGPKMDRNEIPCLHVVITFNNSLDILAISKEIEQYEQNNGLFVLTIDQLDNLLSKKNRKCVITVHGIKQPGRNAIDNPNVFSDVLCLKDSLPILVEDNRSFHKLKLLEKLKSFLSHEKYQYVKEENSISALDRQNQATDPSYIWAPPTFDGLFYSSLMSETRVFYESNIVFRPFFLSKMEIRHSEKTELKTQSIIFSEGLNSIVGISGSGKTLLLDIIYRKLTGKKLPIDGEDAKDDRYKSLYSLDDITLYDGNGKIVENTGISIPIVGESLYNQVISLYKSDQESFLKNLSLVPDTSKLEKYISNYQDKINDFIASSISFSKSAGVIKSEMFNISSNNSFILNNPITDGILFSQKVEDFSEIVDSLKNDIQNKKEDLNNLDSYFKNIATILYKYPDIDTNKRQAFLDAKSYFDNVIRLSIKKKEEKLEKLQIKSFKRKVIKNCIAFISSKRAPNISLVKTYIEKNSQSYKTIIENLISYHLVKLKNKEIPVLDKGTIKNSVLISRENEKLANLKFICQNTAFGKEDFVENIGRSSQQKKRITEKDFPKEEYDFSKKEDVLRFCSPFINEGYTQKIIFPTELKRYLDYSIQLSIKNDNVFQDINTFTPGQLSKLYIRILLMRKMNSGNANSILLFDQPESNLEKSFVFIDLKDILSEIRISHQIFIATHEPLLVINADSNQIICATNNKKIEDMKNEIQYDDLTLISTPSIPSMIDTVSKLIDGDVKAIEKRHQIYTEVNNEN